MEKGDKSWMKPREAAEYLSVHLKTIYSLVNTHQLPAVKLKGVGWRIDRKRLDAQMEGEIEERDRRWRKIVARH
jgi:excisionase family DNA binding protein